MSIAGADLLFPYQKRWILDEAKYAIVEKSRRVGMSMAEAIASVIYSLKHNQDTWYTSTDEEKGKEWINYVRDYCKLVNGILGFEFIDLSLSSANCVPLPNGKKITSLTSSPRRFRGVQGRIVIDEFAAHEDQEELYRAAQGCVVHTGVVRILSTHDGEANTFYRLCREAEDGKPEWSHHRVTLLDAIKEGFRERFAPDKTDEEFVQSIRRNCLSEDAYLQEYMARPLSLSAIVSAEGYDRLALWDVPDTLDFEKVYRPLYYGIDVGRTIDLSVLWVVEQYENPKAVEEHDRYDFKTVCVKAIRNADFPTQHQMFRPIIAHPSIQWGLIDQGSVGVALADSLVDEFPDRCKGYGFTNSRKAELAERLSGFIQTQRVSVPIDPAVRTDFLSVKRSATKSGLLVYEGRTRDSHADYWWAASLAMAAAAQHTGANVVTSKAA